MHLPRPLFLCLAAAFSLVAALPLSARVDADAGAWALVQAANQEPSTLRGMERAIVKLFEAYATTASVTTQQAINTRLHQLHTQYSQLVQASQPLFLDVPEEDEEREQLYLCLARYNDARGLRLYGELLMGRGEAEGWAYLESAAARYEPRALFLLAERYRYGLGGTPAQAAMALHYASLSAQQGYAPAHEMLAQGYWIGGSNLGCPWNQTLAMQHLDEAIRLYSTWRMDDPTTQSNLQQFISRLRSVRTHMGNISSGISFSNGFYPSYDALMLSTYGYTLADLRARAEIIIHEYSMYGGSFHSTRLSRPRLEYVPISIRRCPPQENWMGLCTVDYSEPGSYAFEMEFDTSQLPPAPQSTDSLSTWYDKLILRELRVNNIIAHELAHGFLYSRYSGIHASPDISWDVYEGHATHVACALLRSLYYAADSTRMTDAQYATNWCPENYARSFNWFRHNFLNPYGLLLWDKLDLLEREANGGSVFNRSQRPYKGQVFPRPRFFGRAFYGYM